jgi:hypothetical protein
VAASCHALSGLSDFDADGATSSGSAASGGAATASGGAAATTASAGGGGTSSTTASTGGGGAGGAGGDGCVVKSFGDRPSDDVQGVCEDTYLTQACPLTNWGGDDKFKVDRESMPGAGGAGGTGGAGGAAGDCDAERERRSLLRFDLSSIPSNATLQDATLRLVTSNNNSTGTVSVLVVNKDDDWVEAEATWAFRSTTLGSVAWSTIGCGATCQAVPVGSFIPSMRYTAYDVTLAVSPLQNWITNPDDNAGLVLVATSENGASFVSSDDLVSGEMRPSLRVTYCVP